MIRTIAVPRKPIYFLSRHPVEILNVDSQIWTAPRPETQFLCKDDESAKTASVLDSSFSTKSGVFNRPMLTKDYVAKCSR